MKLIFLHVDKHEVNQVCKLISTLCGSNFPTSWYCHYWWAQSSILKVLKVTSLQYLYNKSEKEVRDEVYFLHADKHQSFYKLALSFLMEVARHAQSTQNRNLVIFLQYLKKKVLWLLLSSVVMQNIYNIRYAHTWKLCKFFNCQALI